MSIVKALNKLSGKEANTIEKAIRNIELGGGNGAVYIDSVWSDDWTVWTIKKTWRELYNYIGDGIPVFIKEVNLSDEHSAIFLSLINRVTHYDGSDYSVVCNGYTLTAESADSFPQLIYD